MIFSPKNKEILSEYASADRGVNHGCCVEDGVYVDEYCQNCSSSDADDRNYCGVEEDDDASNDGDVCTGFIGTDVEACWDRH